MNIFMINTHHYWSISQGKLSDTFIEKARQMFEAAGHNVRLLNIRDGYDIEQELENHNWADFIFLQIPVNWMGVPWPFKKYMDEVYSAGMDGQLCDGDGRSRSDASKQYGSGGTLTGRTYMLSLTFNAPNEAFDDESQYFLQGKGADDLMLPMHQCFRFFGMTPRPTFRSNDVMKNPDIANDLIRFEEHLKRHVLNG